MIELTREAFHAWCIEQEEERVGLSRSALSCPIATYMGTQHVSACVYAKRMKILVPDGEPLDEALPDWAVTFVERLDTPDCHWVLGEEALTVLETIA